MCGPQPPCWQVSGGHREGQAACVYTGTWLSGGFLLWAAMVCCLCCPTAGRGSASFEASAPSALHATSFPPCPCNGQADYAWTLHGLEGEAREEAKKGCHQRGADRLLAVCFANGGIYIKLGQHIGMLVRWLVGG